MSPSFVGRSRRRYFQFLLVFCLVFFLVLCSFGTHRVVYGHCFGGRTNFFFTGFFWCCAFVMSLVLLLLLLLCFFFDSRRPVSEIAGPPHFAAIQLTQR